MARSQMSDQWQLLKTTSIIPDTPGEQPVFRLNALDAGTRQMYMVRPLIFNSHLDEGRVESAVRTLVNHCPFLAGRLHKDPATAEFAILCSNSAGSSHDVSTRVESSLHDHEQHSFGVPLTYVTWDCSVKDVIPGALAVYCEGTPAAVDLLAHPPPFVDGLDTAAALQGREALMKVRYTSLKDGSILCVLLSHTVADGTRFANLMSALAAAYRGATLPPMSHDRTLLTPANLVRAVKEVLGMEVVVMQEVDSPSTSGSTVTGGGHTQESKDVTNRNGGGTSKVGDDAAAVSGGQERPGPSLPQHSGSGASSSLDSTHTVPNASEQQAGPPPAPAPGSKITDHVLAAVHLPTSVIAALKAAAAEFSQATGTAQVTLSTNDIAMGLFAVARANLSGLPLPGTRRSGAKGSGDSIDASDVPCEPYQAWKLLMLADMVQNGFPLVDALNLKSYLGNLIELWAIDSRDCPWVPELDHLNQDLASHQDSSVDAETAGTSMSSAAVPAKASPITKQVASQLGHTTGSGAIPAADSPSAPAAGTPAQGPDLQHPSSCSTTLAPDNARTGALLQQSWFSAAVGTRTAVARLRSKYTTPACLDWPLLISQCGHKDASQIGALFERHFQSFPATTLGTGTNVSHHDSGDWGGAQLVMAPWGWSTNIPATNMAICQGPRPEGQKQPDGVVLQILVKVGEEVDRLKQIIGEVCPGAVWWGP